MYNNVTKADVAQKSGQSNLNCGEIHPIGLTRVLNAFADISRDDVFLDVGSGIGNVIAQVALESQARLCLGIEIQKHAANLAKKIMNQNLHRFSEFKRVWQVEADIRQLSMDTLARLQGVTIIFTNNLVFDQEAHQKVEELICSLSKLRYVAVARKFCYRHRKNCKRLFCQMFELMQEVEVEVQWTSSLVRLYLFRSKTLREELL
jgi:hypothetical protein